MGDEPFDYIGLPFNDTASVNTMATEMNDSSGRWSYARQLYGHVYTAKTGTLSELVAAGDQFNLQHITLNTGAINLLMMVRVSGLVRPLSRLPLCV